MPRRVVIACAYSPANLGDGAIVAGMIQAIRRVDPATDIHVSTFTPDAQLFEEILGVSASAGVFAVPTLGSRVRRARFLISVLPAALLLALGSLAGQRVLLAVSRVLGKRRRTEVRRMAAADVVIAAGGGYLNDYYSAIVPFLLLELWVASGTGTRVVLGAQTIGPMRSLVLSRLFRLVARRTQEIQARDRYSMGQIAAIAPRARDKCKLVPDYAFSDSDGEGHVVRTRTLAISVRFWHFKNAADPEAAQARYWSSLRELVEWWTVEESGDVLLVPTNYRTPGSRDDDLAACHRLWGSLGLLAQAQTSVETTRLSAAGLRSTIAGCAAFVGTRMHACIFALVVGTPVVVIPYQEKSAALMDVLGLEHDVFWVDRPAGRTLIDAVRDVMERSAGGERQLSTTTLAELRRQHDVALLRTLNGSAVRHS